VHFLGCLLDFYYRWAAFDFGYFSFNFFQAERDAAFGGFELNGVQ